MDQSSESALTLLQNLRMLLKEKESNDKRYTTIRISADDAMKKIETTLSKTPSQYHEEILEKAIYFTEYKMNKKILDCNDIFMALTTYVEDVKKNLLDDKYTTPEIERMNYIRGTKDVIDKYLAVLKDYNRYELISYEENCNKLLKERTSVYGRKTASGGIIGALNRGMYGQTREEFIDELREDGVKLSSNTRFIRSMSNELIKYRIVGLYIASKYCDRIEERWKKNATDSDSNTALKDYNEAKVKTKILGGILKDVYSEKYNITPKDEIKNHLFDGDQTVMDFMTTKSESDKNNQSPKR